MSARQKDITFGGNNSLDVQYQNWRSLLASLTATITTTVVSVPGNMGAHGDTYVIAPSVQALISSTTVALLNAYPSLHARLLQSSEQHLHDALASIDASLVPNIVVCILFVLILIIEFVFVFADISNTLDSDENGTRVTLNMIPQNVRDLIPKIAMYLETGSLVEETEEVEVYSRTPSFRRFLSDWAADVPAAACYEQLDQCASHHGFIVINAQGIIQHQSKHIFTLLGYDDLAGQNISVLVSEPLKSLHDGFLRRFAQQGNSRIVGSGRDVVGVAKNGNLVHMYLYLDCSLRTDGEVSFIGQLELYNMDKFKEKN
jgi:PAS domain S-box-containing protein